MTGPFFVQYDKENYLSYIAQNYGEDYKPIALALILEHDASQPKSAKTPFDSNLRNITGTINTISRAGGKTEPYLSTDSIEQCKNLLNTATALGVTIDELVASDQEKYKSFVFKPNSLDTFQTDPLMK